MKIYTVEPLYDDHHWDQRFRGVATNQGFYKYYFNGVETKVSGHYRERGRSSIHQAWPLRGVPLYSLCF